MAKNAEMIEDLQHSALFIRTRPSTAWANLVLYMIEILEQSLDKPTATRFLQALLVAIQTRLNVGEW